MTIGDRIKTIRGNLSRDKFAPIMCISKTTLVNYETGLRTPDADFLNKVLAEFPKISPAWLLAGEGEMERGSRQRQVNAESGYIDSERLCLIINALDAVNIKGISLDNDEKALLVAKAYNYYIAVVKLTESQVTRFITATLMLLGNGDPQAFSDSKKFCTMVERMMHLLENEWKDIEIVSE
jgi:transcriptional regulator with XRE-family HTH domain